MAAQNQNMFEYVKYILDVCFKEAIKEASDEAAATIAARIEEKFKARAEMFHSMQVGATIAHLRLDHNVTEQLAALQERVEELANQNAEQASLLAGECPECKRQIRQWKPPLGSFAPEAWATLRENGIDPANGHMERCSRKSLKIS